MASDIVIDVGTGTVSMPDVDPKPCSCHDGPSLKTAIDGLYKAVPVSDEAKVDLSPVGRGAVGWGLRIAAAYGAYRLGRTVVRKLF